MSQKSGSLFDMQFITSCISTMLVLLLLGMVVFFVMTVLIFPFFSTTT